MLVLGFFIVMPVNAAEKGTTKDVNKPEIVVQTADKKAEIFKTEMDKVSYIIGTQIGGNLKKADIEVNLELLIQGLKDTLGGKEPALSQDEMQKVYSAWRQRMMAEQLAKLGCPLSKITCIPIRIAYLFNSSPRTIPSIKRDAPMAV